MRYFALAFLILILAVPAMADRDLTSTKLTDTHALTRYEGDCALGNMDPAVTYYEGFIVGDEWYAIPFSPADEGCACADGVRAMAMRFPLVLDETSEIFLQPAIFTSIDDGTGCMVPDELVNMGTAVTISNLPEWGIYDLELPIQTDCMDPQYTYFMAFYVGDPGAYVGLPVDDAPKSCYGFNMWDGVNWNDTVDDFGLEGDLIMAVDLDCCTDPVANEGASWGSVKSLYR